MAAIVNSRFRVLNSKNLKNDIQNSSNGYYVFVGKSDVWDQSLTGETDVPIDPIDTSYETYVAHSNMIAGKKIPTLGGIVQGIPRHDWQYGETYVAWDDRDEDIYLKRYYVIYDFKIYKCLKAGPGASTFQPQYEGYTPFDEGDGYVWKFMGGISAQDTKFLSTYYAPVKTIDSGDVTGDDLTKWNLQQDSANLGGKLYNIVLTNPGSGYDPINPPTVTITGNGSGATATATVNPDGSLASINLTTTPTTDSGWTLYNPNGTGYDVAYVTIQSPTSGTTAEAYVVTSPGAGHGTDPAIELGGFYAIVNVKLEYDEGGEFIVDNDFRQLGIIKNPLLPNGSIMSQTAFNALKTLNLSSVSSSFVAGEYITGSLSGAIAFIDSIDETVTPKTIKFHQNEKTGFVNFQAGETVTGSGSGSGVVATSNFIVQPDNQSFTGDIIFIENRLPINRSQSQVEDLKIVIEF